MEVCKESQVTSKGRSVLTRRISFLNLPDDVLFKIFHLLPLRSVLQLEHLCRRLQRAISAYLTTLKVLNICHCRVVQDVFRCYDAQAQSVSSDNLSTLLHRCPHARRIVYLPTAQNLQTDSSINLLPVLYENSQIERIEFCESKEQFTDVIKHSSTELHHTITLGTIVLGRPEISPLKSDLGGSKTMRKIPETTTIHLEDLTIDLEKNDHPFASFNDVSVIGCTLKNQPGSSLTFSNLTRFAYTELPGSGSTRAGVEIMKRAVMSQTLTTLHLELSDFFQLQMIVGDWLATNLCDMQIVSTGSYSAVLQQLKFAVIIAELCIKCSKTLERISLPSSILVKSFFTRILSSAPRTTFPCLKVLDMTGLADTKMFLSPGNLVETRYYQEFLRLCPKITCLSLHSFSGSLSSLALPLTLVELILPWDNRLNFQNQKGNLLSIVGTLPSLQKLSIFGVEEVESLTDAQILLNPSHPLELKVESESLREVRIKNVCIEVLDIKGCVNLSSFVIHCTPHLVDLNLPTGSLESLRIYDNQYPLIKKVFDKFVAEAREFSQSCHIHIQLHSVVKKEPDATVTHSSHTEPIFSLAAKACKAVETQLDYFILRETDLCVSEHNSGEPMYPFTEFQSSSYVRTRSPKMMKVELERRGKVLEALRRWNKCLLDVKTLGVVISAPETHSATCKTLGGVGCQNTASNITKSESPMCAFSNIVCDVLEPKLDTESLLSSNLTGTASTESKFNVPSGSKVGQTNPMISAVRSEKNPDPIFFRTVFCSSNYECITNIPYLLDLSAMPAICQSTSPVPTSGNTSTTSVGNFNSVCTNLNVPRLDISAKEYLRHSEGGTAQARGSVGGGCGHQVNISKLKNAINSKPLLIVSIMEYEHDIHTLFYYS